jgi:hypothetical protein
MRGIASPSAGIEQHYFNIQVVVHQFEIVTARTLHLVQMMAITFFAPLVVPRNDRSQTPMIKEKNQY